MDRKLIEAARRPLATETGAVCKDPAGRLRFCLCYPNSYYLGMSNLGFQGVYWLLNQQDRVACDRAFLPREIDRYRSTGTPVVGIETGRPLRDFHAVGFSLNFELDYAHVPLMLALSGLPPRAADRAENEPLVVLGGPAPTYNPEPLADFADVVLIGEAEEAVGPLSAELAAWALDATAGKGDLLERLAQLPGCYVPSLYRPQHHSDGTLAGLEPAAGAPARIGRLWTRDLDAWPTCSRILTPDTEFGRMFLLELSRGCGRGCRFCVASYCYRPVRRRSLGLLLDLARQGLAQRDTIGLLAAAVTDYPQIGELCEGILAMGGKASFASVRADSLTPEIIRCMQASGTRTVTLAPEAGNDRLRQAINKVVGEEQYLAAARLAWEHGIRTLKLYFIVGLPGETDEDVADIAAFVRRVREVAPVPEITVGAGALVPKPGTPFQRAAMLPPQETKRRLQLLRRQLHGERGVSFAFEGANWSFLQGALARGDRRLGEVIGRAAESNPGSYGTWPAAFRQAGLDPAWYAVRERAENEMLPWGHVG